MSDNRRQVEVIFSGALEKSVADRATFLDEACVGDPALRQRVDALLRANDEASGFLQTPAVAQLQANAERTFAMEDTPQNSRINLEETQRESVGGGQTTNTCLTVLSPSHRPDSLGRIDHYEILRVLGKGGFGTVFKAFDEKLHRMVAIKVLAPELAASGTAKARFLREARAVAAVNHEHVVGTYAIGEEPIPYFVMEYVEGQTLQEKIDKSGPLRLDEILRIAPQIAEGLAAAHKHGLMHRDIKPGNILLENGVERVKITDFGLARAVDDASVTQSGVVAGTPMYMAPEQARGEPLDHRADLFSLGSVLYVMCTGRPPFRAETTLAVLKRVAEDEPRAIREIVPEVPEWFCRIVEKLHAKNPAERFQSAKEVGEVLADCEKQWQAHAELGDYSRIPGGKPTAAASRPEPRKAAVVAVLLVLFFSVIFVVELWKSGRLSSNWPLLPTALGAGIFASSAPAFLRNPRSRLFRRLLAVSAPLILGGLAWAVYSWVTPTPHGVLTIRTYEPGLVVTVDGRAVAIDRITGVTDFSGSTNIGLPPGEHRIQAYKDGQLVFEDAFTLASRETREIDIRKPPPTALTPNNDGWVQLFNGKDLTGWQPLPGGKGTWVVKDRILVGKGQSAFLRADKGPLTDFHLRMEARHVIGEGALIVREQSPDVVGAGYEVTLANNGKGNLNTGSVAIKINKTTISGFEEQPAELTKLGEWFTLDVIVNGNQIRTFVNGKQAVNFVDAYKDYTKGFISLNVGTQDDEGELHVRKIEIKDLPPEEAGWEQLVNGKDIRGWHGDFNLWSVEDGVLVRNKKTIAARDGRDLKRLPSVGDFELKFQAKNESDANLVGVLFRGEAGVVLSPGKSLGGFTPNFRTLDKNLKAAKNADELKKALRPDFNDYYIKCQDKHVSVRVNGVTTIDEAFPELADEGLITLRVQNAESFMAGPVGKVFFRDMQFRALPPLRPWIPLFNGKDLTGWTNLRKNFDAWKVEKGVLIGRGDEAFLRAERGPFSDFHLRMEAKYVGGTAGLVLREHSPDTAGAGYECLMENHKDGDVNTGAIAVMTTKNIMGQLAVPAQALTRSDEWFTLEVIASGNRVQTFVNGQRAVDFVDINREFMEGFIGLNVHGKDGELHVKKIEIKELPPEQRGWIHVFNGVDLNGWTPSPRDKWTVENGALVGVDEGSLTAHQNLGDFHCRIKAKFNAEGIGSVTIGGQANNLAAVRIGNKQADTKTGSLLFFARPTAETLAAWDKQLVLPDTWFDLEIIRRGKKITVKVNRTTTAEKQIDKLPAGRYAIGLHVNVPGTVITVSKVEIRELPPNTPLAPDAKGSEQIPLPRNVGPAERK